MKKIDTTLDELIILSYYGELSPEEQRTLESALASDGQLRQRAEVFRESSELLKHADVPDVDERMLNRLERSILNATVRADESKSSVFNAASAQQVQPTRSFWSTLRDLFLKPQHIGYALAGGLAFLVVGMFIGSQLQMNSTSKMPGATAVLVDSSSSGTPMLAASQQVSDFLRRSQIYFATSVDHEVVCEKCLPIQAQLPNRKIAQDLLKEASALKVKSQGNPEIQKLITDIEFVLDNIGNNAEINPSQAEVVHHIASNAVCEVAARIDSANLQRQLQKQQPK